MCRRISTTMMSTLILTVLLVSLNQAAAIPDDQGEVKLTTLTERDKYCKEDVCKELRQLRDSMAELKVHMQQNKDQIEQIRTENEGKNSKSKKEILHNVHIIKRKYVILCVYNSSFKAETGFD